MTMLLVGLLPLGWVAFGDGYTGSSSSPAYPPSTDGLLMVKRFATGDAYYLDTDSIRPGDKDGQLIYDTIGKNLRMTNGEDYPVSRSKNVINCKDGTFINQVGFEQLDKEGRVTQSQTTSYSVPKALATNSPLYKPLRDACEEAFGSAGAPLKWVREPQ